MTYQLLQSMGAFAQNMHAVVASAHLIKMYTGQIDPRHQNGTLRTNLVRPLFAQYFAYFLSPQPTFTNSRAVRLLLQN